jgi:transcriptional regulator with GAF, ATPase, and Fis domain
MSPDQIAESFEALLASIATRLLGQPVEFFEASIDDILLQLVQFLDVERSTFGVVDTIDGILRTTHAVAVPGVAPFPIGRSMQEDAPWILKQLTKKRVPVIVSSASDLPPEASVELETFRAFGVKSVAIFPIVAGDQLLGGVSFGTTRKERQWPQPIVDRLRLIGEVFAGALLRREHERKLRATLAEVEALRERLQTENEYLRYYRLRVFPIELPPLRARKEDIPVLVWHFLGQLGASLGTKIERVPAVTMDRLMAYNWPGNIRELRNVLERAVILSPGSTLLLEELGESVPGAGAATTDAGGLRTLEDVERDHILRVLESCDWRVRGKDNAASRLGLNASTLYSRMKKLGIRRHASRRRPTP